jgi:adenylate kinase family enzyme
MQRILVIGPGGAGKSTFARRLAERTGLPLVHLDALYWRPGWVEPPKQEWHATVQTLIAGDRWILDGNYGGTMEERIRASDTVIFLDAPRSRCLLRVLRRRLAVRGGVRPDVAPGCPERLTWSFLWWIWTYPTRRRAAVLARLAALRPDQLAVTLRSTEEVEAFFASVPPSGPLPPTASPAGEAQWTK